MIINGGSRSNARFFARHLTNGQDNESVMVCEIRHLAAQSVAEAFREMEAVALGTQCKNFFYHANVNPLETEALTPEQWIRAADALEENLGLAGHARFVVEHRKKGRTHRHIIWLRIDVMRMRAVEMTDDYEKHQATSRQLEREFGLETGDSVLGLQKRPGKRPARRAKAWESFRGQKSGINPHRMKEEITLLYRASGNGAEFVRALAERGYRLVKGAAQDFCIRDSAGHIHSLVRRLDGVPAKVLAAFMAGTQLPSLAESGE